MEALLGELAFWIIILVIHPSEKNGLKNTEVTYLTKLSIRNEGETKTFPIKQKLKKFIASRPAIKKC